MCHMEMAATAAVISTSMARSTKASVINKSV